MGPVFKRGRFYSECDWILVAMEDRGPSGATKELVQGEGKVDAGKVSSPNANPSRLFQNRSAYALRTKTRPYY